MNRGTKGLEMWCRRQVEGYPGVTITNMTTSWKNGMAFCALVHRFRPDLIDFEKLNKADVFYNNELAFKMAELHLGIPALLDANDMVIYEVPDRLSILTYLSQYYQRFASQESKIIPADKSGAITNATAAPQKMSPVVGVPKREPCQKCGNPVFFAERVSVGRSLYHRTCLRCARCDSQLTLGSFYETETDGVYCCETCPDEETSRKHSEQSNTAGDSLVQDTAEEYLHTDPTRKSFSEKLAMFQTNDKALLQKSLSDEEKSKSLQRLSEIYARNMSTADAVIEKPSIPSNEGNDGNDFEPSTDSDSENEELSSTLNTIETNEEIAAPPILSKPPPPSKANVLNKIYGSAALPLPIKIAQRNVSIYESDTLIQRTTELANESTIANRTEELSASQATESIASSSNAVEEEDEEEPMTSSARNDEKNAMPSNLQEPETIPKVTKDEAANCNECTGIDEEIDKTAPSDNVVAEVDMNLVSSSEKAAVDSVTDESNDIRTTAENDQISSVTSAIAEDELGATEQAIMPTVPSKPVPVKRALMPTEPIDGDNQPPTPMRRKNISTVHADESTLVTSDSANAAPTPTPIGEATPSTSTTKEIKVYPTELNPFGDSDDDEEDTDAAIAQMNSSNGRKASKLDSSNPFDSSDDEIELLKEIPQKAADRKSSAVRISTNPFGSDTEDEDDHLSVSLKRTPVPTPRKVLNVSMPSRNSSVYGSVTSLTSTTPRHKKGRAPAAPSGPAAMESKSLSFQHSAASSPSHSNGTTPMLRKKRPAPLPPPKSLQPHELSNSMLYMTARTQLNHSFGSCSTLALDDSINQLDTSLQSNDSMPGATQYFTVASSMVSANEQSQRKLIPIDASLLEDMPLKSLPDLAGEENVCYRRTIVPTELDNVPSTTSAATADDQQQNNDRQWEKMKQNKESQNKNRQSQAIVPVPSDDSELPYGSNKSSYGKWKRRKGPAPSLPIPPRKVLQMLPLEDIRHELEVIEVQQQGLEKQGVQLEKMIRERCEGGENAARPIDEFKPNSKEVEDLILQLFELVNEKNELFRRQAELMYLRRQHRLEQEQADLEYEIRVLMAQPECNKTDSDKSREETLISRLLEVVQLRNAVIESLEMDRRREAEEDQSIKERMEMHTAQRDKKLTQPRPTKLSKKEKKKQKESKKLAKLKKTDADKDADESEVKLEHGKEEKKKKKKFLF